MRKIPPLPTCSPAHKWWSIALVAAIGIPGVGCGSACPQIGAERTAFFARTLDAPTLHGSLDLPFDTVNQLFAEQLRGMPPVPVDLPGLGKYRKQIGGLAIAPKSVRLKPGKPGKLHFDLDFAVVHRARELFSLATTAEVAPAIESGRLLIPIGPEALRAVRPTLGPDAGGRLAGFLYDLVPGPARLMVTRATLRKVADRALAELVDGGYALLRDSVVAQMAPRTRIALDLPALPIDGVRISSQSGWLAIGLETRMPVEGRLPRTVKAPAKDHLRVRLLGGAVAALGNRAIAAGDLPQRLTEKGKPSKDGPFRPGLSWESGDRPAKIWLWKEQDQCMRARVGGTPELSTAQNAKRQSELRVAIADGTLEDVDGPALITVGAWIQSLWADAIKVSKAVVAQTGFEVGERRIEVAVQQARVVDDVVELELSARHR